MSTHLNPQQTQDWHVAVQAPGETEAVSGQQSVRLREAGRPPRAQRR